MTRISKEKLLKKNNNNNNENISQNIIEIVTINALTFYELIESDFFELKAGVRNAKMRRILFKMWLLCQDVNPIIFDVSSHSIYSTNYLFLQPVDIHRIFHQFHVIDSMVDHLDFVQNVNHQIQNHFLGEIMKLDLNLIVETNVLL